MILHFICLLYTCLFAFQTFQFDSEGNKKRCPQTKNPNLNKSKQNLPFNYILIRKKHVIVGVKHLL